MARVYGKWVAKETVECAVLGTYELKYRYVDGELCGVRIDLNGKRYRSFGGYTPFDNAKGFWQAIKETAVASVEHDEDGEVVLVKYAQESTEPTQTALEVAQVESTVESTEQSTEANGETTEYVFDIPTYVASMIKDNASEIETMQDCLEFIKTLESLSWADEINGKVVTFANDTCEIGVCENYAVLRSWCKKVTKKKGGVTKGFKVYGRDGHRQRESFSPSCKYDWSDGDDIRIVELINSDKTGTNDYSIIRITRNTEQEVMDELEGQLYDGIFENSRYGKVEEILK